MRKAIPRGLLTWIALLQVFLLVIAFAAPAAAATTDSDMASNIQLLRAYRIVIGDETGNLHLDQPIKRSEMITIIVRAVGGEDEVEFYRGLPIFSDTNGKWHEGYINYAATKGLVKGDGTGRVNPEANITYAEALTLLVRLAGQEPTTGQWPVNVLLAAAELGIVPAGVTMETINTPAIRGLIFNSLAQVMTTVKRPDGKTLLQAYIDSEPPQLSVNNVTSPTKDATVRVSGTATDAARVLVNGQEATLRGNSWFADVNLNWGQNTIKIVAEDLAGNQTTREISVERTQPIAKLTIEGPKTVTRGRTADYTVRAFNQSGQEVSLDGVTAKVEGNIGSFNLSTGKLTASSQAGKGKIVVSAGNVSASIDVEIVSGNPNAYQLRIRPVNEGRSVSVTREMVVEVEVVDRNGNFLNDDYGRTVTLTASGISGLTVTPTTAETVAGVATFRIRSSQVGAVSLQATSSGLLPASGTGTFGTSIRVQLSADPSSLTIGGAMTMSRIRATLVDDLGNPTPNTTGSAIYILLNQSGTDGFMSDPYMTIMPGSSSSSMSGDDGMYTMGATGGTARITGTITSGQNITVDPTSVTVTMPQVGAASGWDIIYPGGQLQKDQEYTFYLRMADKDGNTIPGSFAFQLEVTTSNNDPENVTILLASGANPVSDGKPEGSADDGYDVIGRTLGGVATLKIRYTKVGQVQVKVVGMPATNIAHASDGTVGSATAGNIVPAKTFNFNFTTTATHVKLEVDSPALGSGKDVGAVSTNGTQTFKVRAVLTDASGSWIPGTTGTATIKKEGTGNSTVEPSIKTVPIVDGKAEWTVTSTGIPGTDVYSVTATASIGGNVTPLNTVQLIVQNQKPNAPTVLAARGQTGSAPGSWYYVSPTDTHLSMDLATNGSQSYGVVKVYVLNNSTPFFTSAPVNLSGTTVSIQIPKSVLPKGRLQYQVSFQNAVGESARVTTPEFVTNASVATNITINSARFDRVNKRLIIYGSGFGSFSGTYQDTLNPHLLTITDVSLNLESPGTGTVNLAGAQIQPGSSNSSTLTLGLTDQLVTDLSKLSGADVTLNAAQGWYVRYSGEIAAEDNGNPVTPMAKVNYAAYDRTNRRLTLHGAGFSTGTLQVGLLEVSNGVDQPIKLNTYQTTNWRQSDSEWIITIANVPGLEAALQTGGYELNLLNGWFTDGSVSQTAETGIDIYEFINVTGIDYANDELTIYGSGFSGWGVNPAKLDFVKVSGSTQIKYDVNGTWDEENSSDTVIKIKLKSPNPLGTDLTGTGIYVVGEAGWMTSGIKSSAPIPLWRLLLPNIPPATPPGGGS